MIDSGGINELELVICTTSCPGEEFTSISIFSEPRPYQQTRVVREPWDVLAGIFDVGPVVDIVLSLFSSVAMVTTRIHFLRRPCHIDTCVLTCPLSCIQDVASATILCSEAEHTPARFMG